MSQAQISNTQIKKVCKKFHYRNNAKALGLTKTVVIMNGKVLKPSSTRRSRTGTHGEDYYCLSQEEWQKTWIVTFEQSNSGRRYITVTNVPDNVRELIEQIWLYEDVSIEEIASIVAKLQTMNNSRVEHVVQG
jgi:hypothetical protein